MTQPNLGYGAPSEATINQVNTWMRSTPWYQQLLRSWGQNPNNVHLNDAQKTQIVRAAQANGVVVDEGKQEIDDSGNFRNQGHALRNTLIVAGLAGATIATMGAAGAFAGAAGAGAAGSGAAAGTGIAALPGALTAVPALGGSAAAGVGASLAGAGAAGAAGAGAAGTGAAMAPVVAPTAAGIWGAGGAGTTAIGVGATLFGNLFGAHMSSSAASEAAAEQAAALKYSADLQAKGAADALAFTRSQAENAFQNNEASRHGNYDQWAARERRIGSVGDLLQLGLGPREIPQYVPGVDPNFGGSSAPAGPGGPAAASGPAPAIDASKGDIGQQVSAFFKSRGVADTETPYWVQKWSEFGQKDPAFFNSRLAQADIFGKSAPAAAAAPRTVGDALSGAPTPTPYAPTPIAAPLTVQPYQVRSPGSYLYAGGY